MSGIAWLGSCLVLALGAAACQDQRTDPIAPPAGTGARFTLAED